MSSKYQEIKMKSVLTVLITLTALFSLEVFAHGDHGPGQAQPTKGGVIMEAEGFLVEAVGSKTEVKFYPLKEQANSKVLKPIPVNEIKLEATYTLPRAKTPTPMTLTKAADHFVGSVNVGSAHRYQVDVKAQLGTVKDTLTFQIEPQE